ncbi:hypothetical protein [Mucilaginibacter sp. 3215]|uniref:hypothetical protein n=1 Tax=Mucilaginibacter sp. 3215 TaxID=3373912 RepID=UPI003D22D930
MMYNIAYEELIKRAYNTKKHGVPAADAALFDRVHENEYKYLADPTNEDLKDIYMTGLDKLRSYLTDSLTSFLKETDDLNDDIIDQLLDDISLVRESNNIESLSEAIKKTRETFDKIDEGK